MFSPDSKFMEILSRITDLILLNILFLITCLPIFTIGAAATSLYTMCFRLMREEYRGIIRSYFAAFRSSFKQATVLWGLLLLAGIPALYYLSLVLKHTGILQYTSMVFILIFAVVFMTGSYVFPWISQFENTTMQALKNALLLSISHFPRTLAVLAINLMPVIVFVINADLFVRISFLWVALYFAAAADMNTGILWHVFKPYRDQ